MSNPIADTAEYFAEKESGSSSKRTNKLPAGLKVFPSQEQVHTPLDLLSPESPASRRPPPLTHQTRSDFDPKLQWQKMVKRLPNIHHHHSSSRRSSQDNMNNNNDSSDSEHEEYEMGNRGDSAVQYMPPNEEDDILPSAEEIKSDENSSVADEKLPQERHDDDNFFTNPFADITTGNGDKAAVPENKTATMDAVIANDIKKKKKKDKKKKLSGRTSLGSGRSSSSSSSSSSSGSDGEEQQEQSEIQPPPPAVVANGRAKKHWGKTLDKVRLIANLHTLPHQPKPTSTITSTSSLAPYYPPLFDPVFIALSKDPHGHPWPPVLLPFLNVAITDSELVTQGINQWVFRIELQYGDIKWVINRTIAEFVSLHYTLKFKSSISDAVPSPPSFPSQLESWLSSAKGTIGYDNADIEDTSAEKYQIALKRRKALTKYLQKLLIRAHMMANYDICEFLEISAVSIVEDMGWKGKEGFLENKVNFVVPRLCQILKPHLWTKQWVILRDSYVAFISDVASTRIDDVFLFDKNLVVQDKTPGLFGKYHNHISMANQFRRIEIKGGRREIQEWKKSIQRVLNDSPWVKNHRFGSFAPIRHNAKVRWFVDGEDHFNAVGEAILSAKSEIYIADWWLSPELYLRRPPEKNQEFRLDRLLKRKAEEGVKIYIVVYKEMAVALTINSAHTKSWLQNLHKNIIVVRHPDHRSIDNNVLFWSHHEKIVVVDNRLAFIGGLDMCWGRYDSQSHRLTDYPAEGHANEVFPGQDYSNPRVKDFLNVAQYDMTLVDRNITPRMPWHDMTVGMVGPAARDVARHFIQRWNFLKASKGMHRPTVPFLMPKGEYVAARDESSFKGTCRIQMLRSSAQWSSGIEREHSIYNAYMECISKSKHYIYIENQFFISATTQDKLLRNKIAQAIVERIKRAHAKGEKYKVFIVIPLIPAFEGDLASKDASAARNVMHFQYITISRGGNSIMEKLREANIEPSDYIGWYSLRNWDKLVPKKKASATPSATTKPSVPSSPSLVPEAAASSTESLKDPLSPRVTPIPSQATSSTAETEKSIWDDDDREYYVSELVYIHDKILIVDDRIVLIGSANINDRSQLGNRDSEIAMLIEDTDMVSSYMDGKEYKAAKFAHSLRMQLFKEHLGLLNFNDWEKLLQGENVATEPNVTVDGTPTETHHANEHVTEEEIQQFEKAGPAAVLNYDKRSKVTDFCGDSNGTAAATTTTSTSTNTTKARVDAQVLDPLADHCCKDIWNATAKNNTLIYRELFRCVPDDTVHTFEQHRKFLPDPTKIPHGHIADPELHGRDIRQKLARVRGHLVQFPSDYLKDENMLGSLIRETVTPMVIFT